MWAVNDPCSYLTHPPYQQEEFMHAGVPTLMDKLIQGLKLSFRLKSSDRCCPRKAGNGVHWGSTNCLRSGPLRLVKRLELGLVNQPRLECSRNK